MTVADGTLRTFWIRPCGAEADVNVFVEGGECEGEEPQLKVQVGDVVSYDKVLSEIAACLRADVKGLELFQKAPSAVRPGQGESFFLAPKKWKSYCASFVLDEEPDKKADANLWAQYAGWTRHKDDRAGLEDEAQLPVIFVRVKERNGGARTGSQEAGAAGGSPSSGPRSVFGADGVALPQARGRVVFSVAQAAVKDVVENCFVREVGKCEHCQGVATPDWDKCDCLKVLPTAMQPEPLVENAYVRVFVAVQQLEDKTPGWGGSNRRGIHVSEVSGLLKSVQNNYHTRLFRGKPREERAQLEVTWPYGPVVHGGVLDVAKKLGVEVAEDRLPAALPLEQAADLVAALWGFDGAALRAAHADLDALVCKRPRYNPTARPVEDPRLWQNWPDRAPGHKLPQVVAAFLALWDEWKHFWSAQKFPVPRNHNRGKWKAWLRALDAGRSDDISGSWRHASRWWACEAWVRDGHDAVPEVPGTQEARPATSAGAAPAEEDDEEEEEEEADELDRIEPTEVLEGDTPLCACAKRNGLPQIKERKNPGPLWCWHGADVAVGDVPGEFKQQAKVGDTCTRGRVDPRVETSAEGLLAAAGPPPPRRGKRKARAPALAQVDSNRGAGSGARPGTRARTAGS
ncbi:unnamed protein product [Pedinophyceae sp. YPF-701]|nr:unnamed protein product [Pedinophyceae sp. YPF-701]